MNGVRAPQSRASASTTAAATVGLDAADDAEDDGHGGYSAPMNGTLISVQVKAGQTVKEGDTLVIMEAMKMEHSIKAHADGEVSAVFFKEGELVSEGDILIQLEENE